MILSCIIFKGIKLAKVRKEAGIKLSAEDLFLSITFSLVMIFLGRLVQHPVLDSICIVGIKSSLQASCEVSHLILQLPTLHINTVLKNRRSISFVNAKLKLLTPQGEACSELLLPTVHVGYSRGHISLSTLSLGVAVEVIAACC